MTLEHELDRTAFERDGFTIIPGFYDYERQVEPIRQGVRWIVETLCRKHGVDAPVETVEEAMGPGYLALAAANRSWGGEVYDAVKQIPGFMSLVSDPRNAEVFRALRPDAVPGLAAGGYGIRIDSPGEEKFRAAWHQEFPAQLRSPDGMVFWSPLIPITADLGPVELAVGSHKEGIVPVRRDDGGVGKSGAYALRLDREEERLARYEHAAPLTNPGDLIVMDFLTLHQSGFNRGSMPRWSMQFRYFNFNDPTGVRLSWKGSFAAGQSFETLLPELVAD
ncbi:phytanoyl-CoA dioxygenase family protein [Stappia sp.]|uniref:phytanoyl-CoA dioxygenase family protein n=1 Tax=Stappia sp. TaxID=1870903 RepID=UPI0032D8CEF8